MIGGQKKNSEQSLGKQSERSVARNPSRGVPSNTLRAAPRRRPGFRGRTGWRERGRGRAGLGAHLLAELPVGSDRGTPRLERGSGCRGGGVEKRDDQRSVALAPACFREGPGRSGGRRRARMLFGAGASRRIGGMEGTGEPLWGRKRFKCRGWFCFCRRDAFVGTADGSA